MNTNARIKTAICQNCQKIFSQTVNQKYCSFDCYNQYRKNNPLYIRRVTMITLICPTCGKEFQRNKQQIRAKFTFCSRHCAGKMSGGFAKSSYTHNTTRIKICEQCGKSFEFKHKNTQRFCSRHCASIDKGNKIHGENNPNYRHGQNQSSAKIIAERNFAMRCILCDFDVAITIHHIIPKSEGGTNHPSNLAVLCPNHHAMADKGFITTHELQSIVSNLLRN